MIRWNDVPIEKFRLADSIQNGYLAGAVILAAWILGLLGYTIILVILLFLVFWHYLNERANQLERFLMYALSFRGARRIKGIVNNAETLPENSFDEMPESLESGESVDVENLFKISELIFDRKQELENSPLEISVLNAYINACWPQFSLNLEKRLRKSISSALSIRKDRPRSFIRNSELSFVRFQQGTPIVDDIRVHNWGWKGVNKEDLVIEAKLRFEGMLRVGLRLSLIVGGVNVVVGITNLECTIRLKFGDRCHYPPFMKSLEIKVVDHPVLRFSLHVGGFDPSKIPVLENFIREKFLKRIRNASWSFIFRGQQMIRISNPMKYDDIIQEDNLKKSGILSPVNISSSPDSPTILPSSVSGNERDSSKQKSFSNGGILHIYIESLDSASKNSIDSSIFDDEALEVSMLPGSELVPFEQKSIKSIVCQIEFNGSLTKQTKSDNSGVWNEKMSFIVRPEDIDLSSKSESINEEELSSFNASGSQNIESKLFQKSKSFKKLNVNVKIIEHAVYFSSKKSKSKEHKRVFKASFDVLKVIGTRTEEEVLQSFSCPLLPSSGGAIQLRILWEPVKSFYDFNHLPTLLSVGNWKENFQMGILSIQVIRCEETETFGEKISPFIQLSFGHDNSRIEGSLSQRQSFSTKSISASRSQHWDEEFVFLMNSFDERLEVTLHDANFKDTAIAKTKIDIWSLLRKKSSLCTYSSFRFQDINGKDLPSSIILGFGVYPTNYFLNFSRRTAFEQKAHQLWVDSKSESERIENSSNSLDVSIQNPVSAPLSRKSSLEEKIKTDRSSETIIGTLRESFTRSFTRKGADIAASKELAEDENQKNTSKQVQTKQNYGSSNSQTGFRESGSLAINKVRNVAGSMLSGLKSRKGAKFQREEQAALIAKQLMETSDKKLSSYSSEDNSVLDNAAIDCTKSNESLNGLKAEEKLETDVN